MMIARLAVLAACMVALSAQAGVIRSAVDVTGPANYSPDATTMNLANQSGLSATYVSGVTDFDSYVANTSHDSSMSTHDWANASNAALIFDLGGAYDISGLALWNRGITTSAQGIKDFALYSCSDAGCANEQLIGNFVALAGLELDERVRAQTFSFAGINTAFIKLDITSNYNTRYGIVTLGEVAFREQTAAAAVPEPASLALVMLALGGLAAVRRKAA